MPGRKAGVALLAAAAFGTAAFLAARRGGPAGNGEAGPSRLRVVVVGAGFGGLSAAEALAREPGIDLTLIDAQNHHLFQPLLYQVATAALSPADIAAPVRSVLPVSDRLRVVMSGVTGVDGARGQVLCGDRAIPFDRLIIATGSVSSYFGHDDWAADAPGLKTLDDALRLRNSIVSAFERAAVASDADERRRLLTFVVIGGGPTGVEMAGSIGQYIQDRLPSSYGLDSTAARVLLVEAGDRTLAEFAPDLSAHAAAELRKLGVEIRTRTKVTGIEPGRVQLGDTAVEAGTVIWAAGTAATPVADWLGVKPGHGGRVEVGPDLRVAGHDNVFVIGDAALARDGDGHPLPGLAPVAKQQGAYVADAITRDMRGDPAPAPFRYKDFGILATIGRNKAVAQFGTVRVSGLPAWLLWAGVHIAFLIDFRSRLVVSLEWAISYATHGRAAGLIIPAISARAPGKADPPKG